MGKVGAKGHDVGPFLIHDGLLFYKDYLCIPSGSVKEVLISELHLGGHFSRDKMIGIVGKRYN